jgi:hypothetical protein
MLVHEIKAEVKIIFQTVEDLHIACQKIWDWYYGIIQLLEVIGWLIELL